jgi:hypothetical protein
MSLFSRIGRAFDRNVLQSTVGQIGLGLINPALGLGSFAYDLLRPRSAQGANLPALPGMPDLTDQAIQIARDREARRQRAGGTSSTFLSGVLGPMDQPSTFVKSMLGS